VPLYPSRLWWRRFNQSAMLARAVGRFAGVPVDCFVLARVRRTQSQVGLSPDQWRRNVAGAFKVSKGHAERVKGKSVVVVDDVITTGDGGSLRAGAEAGRGRARRCAGPGASRRAHRLRALEWPVRKSCAGPVKRPVTLG
jgi:hypothetical protein